MIETLLPYMAALIVAGTVYLLYYATGGRYLNPEDDWWNDLRRSLVPRLDNILRDIDEDLCAVNKAYQTEYVATVKADYMDMSMWFDDMGYNRSPLAGLKYFLDDDAVEEYGYGDERLTKQIDRFGEYELSSWAKREAQHPHIPDPLAKMQVHLFVFDNPDGTFDLYAHYEHSSMCPLPWVAIGHYRGKAVNHEEGVRRLLDDISNTPSDDVAIVEKTDGQE